MTHMTHDPKDSTLNTMTKEIISAAEAALSGMYPQEADILRLTIRELQGAPAINLRGHWTQVADDDPNAFAKISEGITGYKRMLAAGYTAQRHLEARGCEFIELVHYAMSLTSICDVDGIEEDYDESLVPVLLRMWFLHMILVHGLCAHQVSGKTLHEYRVYHQLLSQQ